MVVISSSYLSIPLDVQNYIATSDIVFSKSGWGTISETLIAKGKLMLIEREDVIEDTHNIAELKNRNLAISITEKNLENLDVSMIEQEISNNISIDKLNQYNNERTNIIEILDLD